MVRTSALWQNKGTTFVPLGYGFVISASFNETAQSAVLTIKGDIFFASGPPPMHRGSGPGGEQKGHG